MTERKNEPNNSAIEEGEQIYRQMLALFQSAATKYSKRKDIESYAPFGNNFMLLFKSIKENSKQKIGKGIEMYFKKAEKVYGVTWTKFLSENAALITQIEGLIEGLIEELKLPREINRLHIQLYKKQLLAIAERAEQDIDYGRIEVDVWQRLNPLLEQASETMRRYGMDPEKFYG